MFEYVHGGNAMFESGGEGLLDLSANINPLGLSEEATRAVTDCLPHCAAYPDSACRRLKSALAAHENVPADWLFPGAGASDIFFRLARYAGAKKAWIPAPSFADYERCAKASGAEVVFYPMAEEMGFLLTRAVLDSLKKEKPDLVFVCNPNNPTGLLTPIDLMEEIAALCHKQNAILAVDECFLDFVQQAERCSALPLLKHYDNLVVVKAFTKTFAMPGLRLGYAMTGNPQIIEGLARQGPDWAVSLPAQAAGLAVLPGAKAYLEETVRYVKGARETMQKELRHLGCHAFDSQANYVFFRIPFPFDLVSALDGKGIRIRACKNYRGLDERYYRVAVSTQENNRAFLKAMKEVVPWRIP